MPSTAVSTTRHLLSNTNRAGPWPAISRGRLLLSLVRLDEVIKTFQRGSGPIVHAVNGVSLTIETGETVAIIGESGSGKSTVGKLALGLLQPDAGSVHFEGAHLGTFKPDALRAARARMTIVFQEPYESLDPRMSIGDIVAEPLVIHERSLDRVERRRRVLEALADVSLTESHYDKYPHELSGGQQQRTGIARAIVTRPSFIVLDEPTSSLDLSVRAQILQLLNDLQRELSLAYLFISHDIHTVEYVSDQIAVMYLGKVVESGPVSDVFREPKHPYTQALLSSTVSADPDFRRERLVLEGEIPTALSLPSGCVLYGRCPIGSPDCGLAPVPLKEVGSGRKVACLKATGGPAPAVPGETKASA